MTTLTEDQKKQIRDILHSVKHGDLIIPHGIEAITDIIQPKPEPVKRWIVVCEDHEGELISFVEDIRERAHRHHFDYRATVAIIPIAWDKPNRSARILPAGQDGEV